MCTGDAVKALVTVGTSQGPSPRARPPGTRLLPLREKHRDHERLELRSQGSPVNVHPVNRPEDVGQLSPAAEADPCGGDVRILFGPEDLGPREPRLYHKNKAAAPDTHDAEPLIDSPHPREGPWKLSGSKETL